MGAKAGAQNDCSGDLSVGTLPDCLAAERGKLKPMPEARHVLEDVLARRAVQRVLGWLAVENRNGVSSILQTQRGLIEGGGNGVNDIWGVSLNLLPGKPVLELDHLNPARALERSSTRETDPAP